ncbi:hypothetical protein Tco_0126544 [Tanacetum coccineum]
MYNQLAVSYIRLLNGSLACFILSAESNESDIAFSIPRALSVQYPKLMSDGRLVVTEWNLQEWTHVADIIKSPRGKCGHWFVEKTLCTRHKCLDGKATRATALGLRLFKASKF